MKEHIFNIIDIRDTHVKMVRLMTHQGTPAILSWNVQKNDGPELSGLGARIKQNFISQRGGESKEVSLVIPRRLVVIKQIHVPSIQESEIKRILDLQIARHVPYPREKIIFDFYILQKEEDGSSRVVIVATHKDLIEHYLQQLQASGLHAQHILVSSFCLLRWYHSLAEDVDLSSSTLIVNYDDGGLELCFAGGGQVIFSRHIAVNTPTIEKDFSEVVEELDLTMNAFMEQYPDCPVQKIIVAASKAGGEFLRKSLASWSQRPVELFIVDADPAIQVANSDKPNENNFSFAVSLGAVSGKNRHDINLIPAEVLDTKKIRSQRKEFIKFIIAAVVTCCLAIGAWSIDILQDILTLRTLEQQLTQLKSPVQDAEEHSLRVSLVQEQMRSRLFIADMMRTLYALTPEEISFQSVQMNSAGILTLNGYDNNGEMINLFQRQLMASDFFNDVNLQYATKRKRFRQEYTDFRITCMVSKQKDVPHE